MPTSTAYDLVVDLVKTLYADQRNDVLEKFVLHEIHDVTLHLGAHEKVAAASESARAMSNAKDEVNAVIAVVDDFFNSGKIGKDKLLAQVDRTYACGEMCLTDPHLDIGERGDGLADFLVTVFANARATEYGDLRKQIVEPLTQTSTRLGEIASTLQAFADTERGGPLLDDEAVREQIDCARVARKLSDELFDTFDSLNQLGEEYGQATLVDLIYLQQAVLTGSFIDALGDSDSKICEVINQLPSAEQWNAFIRYEMPQQRPVVRT